ncbi:MAG: hypothetical protein AVDCRST_MAG25-2176 [uncultured Rubrobacteraceae bacterium]|uniref:Uncharacterized protein n=1 Tax=uncultured Rubrobacteraceae bacterium TaxID=349277 RepID=A0A6J4RGA5_9ACTN|nr:MAG: hypothetical protein AVDCRST_MAG25-2176 [uncultured Rubrobacteraceae bacterium]
MPLFKRSTLADQMAVEIQQEAALYKERCKNLHEEFRERLRRRDETKAELAEIDTELSRLQGRGISLLGQLNDATRSGDDDRLREMEKSYGRNSRELDRVGRRREKAARRFAAADLDEEESARSLARAASDLLDEHAARTRELKGRLIELLDTLDVQKGEVSRAAASLIEEHDLRRRPNAAG